jgi:hypothetical protein
MREIIRDKTDPEKERVRKIGGDRESEKDR